MTLEEIIGFHPSNICYTYMDLVMFSYHKQSEIQNCFYLFLNRESRIVIKALKTLVWHLSREPV